VSVDAGVGSCTCEDVDIGVGVDGTPPEEVDICWVVVVVVVLPIFNTTSPKKASPTKIFSWGEGAYTAMNELAEDGGDGVPVNADKRPSSLLSPRLTEVPREERPLYWP